MGGRAGVGRLTVCVLDGAVQAMLCGSALTKAGPSLLTRMSEDEKYGLWFKNQRGSTTIVILQSNDIFFIAGVATIGMYPYFGHYTPVRKSDQPMSFTLL